MGEILECKQEKNGEMKKYTEGKWQINDDYSKSTVLSETGFPIAETSYTAYGNFKRSVNEIKANAKLIAAAPEMLEALMDVVRILESNPTYTNLYQRNKINALIKKTTE